MNLAANLVATARSLPERPAIKLDEHGFAKADFSGDDARLDAWITNPQAVIPGAVMAYRQAKPETRAAIIGYLKELH